MSILIKSVEHEGARQDIHIVGDRIVSIAPKIEIHADKVIDGVGKAVIPGFVNMHTHAAMTLFRGVGDDMPLMPWLEEVIWPNEAKLTDEDVYWGAKLACVEMIRSGTTTFFDMYQRPDATATAVGEMGIRAVLSDACFDFFKPTLTERMKAQTTKRFATPSPYSSRVQFAIGPHAIYSVSGELLQWIDAFAKEHGLLVHLHLAETMNEVEQSLFRFGLTPVRYLQKLGLLSPRLVLAHVLYLDDEEIMLLADHGVKVVHNPASNMKLASGAEFKFTEMRAAGVEVALGTDGCSSSNNLDMIEAMKLASLLGKVWRKDPEAVMCGDIFTAATATGAKMIGLDAGRIEVGALADLSLIDLNIPAFTPNFNFISNLVYAANGSCVDTVICDGRLLMQDKIIPGEEEILARVRHLSHDLVHKR